MKTLSITTILFIIAVLISCASAKESTHLESLLHPKENTYAIGDTAHGGIVFLVNQEGTHGLVCALEDQMINSSYHQCFEMINDPRYHDEYGKKYFDWRLPKLWEAYKMYMNLHMINLGNFEETGYWTSQSTRSFEKMHVLNFSKGIDFTVFKTDTYKARAVRTF
ncbi:MAG: hypothetical protein WDZ35_05580 [Crocinitomicaceae bacterium]